MAAENKAGIDIAYCTLALAKIDELQARLFEEEEEDDGDNVAKELAQLKRHVCGIIADVTDEADNMTAKAATVWPDGQAEGKGEEEVEKTLGSLKLVETTDKSQQLYDSLNSSDKGLSTTDRLMLIKLVAELAKDEPCRECLISQNMFAPLDKLITDGCCEETQRLLLDTQVCRAIGNLCYNNDRGRIAYLDSCGGLQHLVNVCQRACELQQQQPSDAELTRMAVSIGCLHNVTNENEKLRHAAYAVNIMAVLKAYVPHLKRRLVLLRHFISCIENLLELDEGKKQFVSEQVALTLFNAMDEECLTLLAEDGADLNEEFFAFLSLCYEQEKSGEFLVQSKLLLSLLNTIERVSKEDDDESSGELVRRGCLFLVNLLVSDTNVENIFAYENGLLLTRAIDWLASNEKQQPQQQQQQQQLFVASAVIIANYMRNDEKALQVIRDPRKPHLQLLGILEQSVSCVDASAAAQSPLTSAPTQQQQQAANTVHSVLGALRNFCVSATVRTELLASCEKRLVATAMRYVRHSNMDVKAKALSVLRLLVRSCSDKSGGALDDVFSSSADGDFLATLEQVLDTKACVEHPSVAGESSRLVCYLPVAAKSEKRMRLLGTGHVRLVHAVCSQLASEHWVMVNEALLALNVLTVVDYASCVDALRTSVVDERMRALFGEQRQATMPVEITLNLMRLFKFLYERQDFFSDEQLSVYLGLFRKLADDTSTSKNAVLLSSIRPLIAALENQLTA